MARVKIGNIGADMRLEDDYYGIPRLRQVGAILKGFIPVETQMVVLTPTTVQAKEWDSQGHMVTVTFNGNIPYGELNLMTLETMGTRVGIGGTFRIDWDSGAMWGWITSELARNSATNALFVDFLGINEYMDTADPDLVDMDDATTLIGQDWITSGRGNDYLLGYAGEDLLASGPGADILDGGFGNDTMKGGLGNDTYLVDSAGDVVVENRDSGTDTVKSPLYSYLLGPNLENLTLTGDAHSGVGNAGNNTITGNSGANLIDGGAGRDTMRGGAGWDTYFVDNRDDVVVELQGKGFDRVYSTVTFTLNENVEELILTGTKAIGGFGNTQNNTITGNDAANRLTGDAGNDLLIGGKGKDTLAGGVGRDTLSGFLGDDIFLFDTAPAAGNQDAITDFTYDEDTIALDRAVFTALGELGRFAAGDERFYAAAGASAGHDANDRVVYDSASGSLYYDADGSGSTAAVKIAILGTATLLSAHDLQVV